VAITAHQWRHTYATSLINKGVRIEVIKQLLDHASLDMASRYANSRELHQTGEKPQVGWAAGVRSGAPRLRLMCA
jgi:integrase